MFNDGKKYNINPSQIDTLANPETFAFAAHNAKTGDPVKYVFAGTNPTTIGSRTNILYYS